MSIPALPLWLSVLATFLAAPLYAAAKRWTGPFTFLHGFIVGGVTGLVLIEVLPRTYEHVGAWVVVAVGAGLVSIFALERLALSPGVRRTTVVIAALALGVHILADGVALRLEGEGLSAAVVLHRLPMATLVWWAVVTRRGPTAATLALAGIAATTAAGYLLQDRLQFSAHVALAVFESVVAGALLHVLHLHAPSGPAAGGAARVIRFAGMAAGFAGVVLTG